MNSGAVFHTETRTVAEGLVANVSVIRPDLITPTGRAAQSRFAITPPGPCPTLTERSRSKKGLRLHRSRGFQARYPLLEPMGDRS